MNPKVKTSEASSALESKLEKLKKNKPKSCLLSSLQNMRKKRIDIAVNPCTVGPQGFEPWTP